MAVTILLVLAMAALSASVPYHNGTFDHLRTLETRALGIPALVDCGTDFPELAFADPGDAYILQTPGFGSTNYAAGTKCGWTLKAAEGVTVVLQCVEVDLNKGDVLEVQDLPEHDLFRLAGTPSPFWYRFRGDGKVLLKSSPTSAGGKGFNCFAMAAPAYQKCLCGKNQYSPTTRMVGGTETEAHTFPWSAHITVGGVYKCGATLISRSSAITAASCITGGKLELIIGVNDRTSLNFPRTKIWVLNVQKHPLYHSYYKTNDIAILSFLSINWEDYVTNIVAPICLPDVDKDYGDGPGTVSGFGATVSGGNPVDKMSQVELTLLAAATCKEHITTLTDRQTCAMSPDGSKDLCDGDTGNPLAVKNGDNYDFVGMVSHDVKCGTAPELPIHVFTQIAAYVPWILENVDICSSCPRA